MRNNVNKATNQKKMKLNIVLLLLVLASGTMKCVLGNTASIEAIECSECCRSAHTKTLRDAAEFSMCVTNCGKTNMAETAACTASCFDKRQVLSAEDTECCSSCTRDLREIKMDMSAECYSTCASNLYKYEGAMKRCYGLCDSATTSRTSKREANSCSSMCTTEDCRSSCAKREVDENLCCAACQEFNGKRTTRANECCAACVRK